MRVLRVSGREGWWLRQPIVQLCPCKLPFCALSRLPLVVGWACTDVQSGEAPSGSKSSSDAPPPRDHADDHGEEGDDDDDDGDEVLNDFEVCVGVWSPISLLCWKPLSRARELHPLRHLAAPLDAVPLEMGGWDG